MGRKTFDFLKKPFDNCETIVFTRNEDLDQADVFFVHNLKEFFDHVHYRNQKKLFIVGGAEIYSLFLPYISK
jgi:dihydrofolate reductase